MTIARFTIWLGLLAGLPAAAGAQETRLRGGYVVTLLGLTVGRGAWEVRVAPDHYIATGQGGSSGLAALISSGSGEASADGAMRDGKPVPRRYDYESKTKDKTTGKYDEIHIVMQDGTVTDLRIDPPQGKHKRRVPLTQQHKEGVSDPIAAVLIPAPGPLGPATCDRTLRVFDGRMRYDLQFSFKRIEQVKTDAGYAGPVAVCAMAFRPIAGHVPDRAAIKYLIDLTTMEVWLAPIAGTSIVVPWKVVIPTPFGIGVLQAESFQVRDR